MSTGRQSGGPEGRGRGLDSRGFTLVEVLVAVAITGMISLAIYAVFARTTESLQEADSLATTVNDAQFAVERMRSALRNAGAFGTPDSDHDSWVKPDPRDHGTEIRVAGLVSYSGWQDDRSVLSKKKPDLQSTNERTKDLRASYDGIVVIGAFRYPGSFEIGDIASDGGSGKVFETERGLYKLKLNNPFDVQTGAHGYKFQKQSTYDSIIGKRASGPNLINTEVIRVMDRHGYFQFAGISDASKGKSSSGKLPSKTYLKIEFKHALYHREGNERYGLQPPSQQDAGISYEAALLDAFWYHVRQDPTDPGNLRLVRERLDADRLIEKGLTKDWSNLDPAKYRAKEGEDYAVIVENVADFQIWFDCAPEDGAGNIVKADWKMEWKPPDGSGTPASGSTAGYNCLDPSDPDPGRARIAHLRLSLRTRTEQDDLEHKPFTTRGGSGTHVQMGTFDTDGDTTDAAAVHTTQIDLELPNFAARNIR
ncbi:MAG: PilW family protein [Bradymonadaceae bacterium]